MKKIKFPQITLLILTIVGISFFFMDKNSFKENVLNNSSKRSSVDAESNSKSSAKVEASKESLIEIEDLQKVTGDTIPKTFDGSYMNPLITVSELKPNFYFDLQGVDKESELILINPNTGEMFEMYITEDGKYTVAAKLEENITYGILMNYNLTGALTIVPDLQDIDEETLYIEVMSLLQCGL